MTSVMFSGVLTTFKCCPADDLRVWGCKSGWPPFMSEYRLNTVI